MEAVALPVAGQVLAALEDGAAFVDQAGAADADERRELHLLLLRALDQLDEHRGDPLDRLVPRRLVVAVPPVHALPDVGLVDVAALVGVELDDARPDVRPADVDRQDGVVPGQDPGRRELHGADQPGFVRVVFDRAQLGIDPCRLEQDRGAPHRQLADAAGDQAAAQHDAFGAFPRLEPQEAADDGGQLRGELLDDSVDQRGGGRIVAAHHLVELGLADLFHRRVTQRIVVARLEPVPPVGEDPAEGTAAGAVADETLLVAQFLVVGVDADGGQQPPAMGERAGGQGRRGGGLVVQWLLL